MSYSDEWFVVTAELVENEEHQPSKYAQQEQHLGNELHKDTVVVGKMAAEREMEIT